MQICETGDWLASLSDFLPGALRPEERHWHYVLALVTIEGAGAARSPAAADPCGGGPAARGA